MNEKLDTILEQPHQLEAQNEKSTAITASQEQKSSNIAEPKIIIDFSEDISIEKPKQKIPLHWGPTFFISWLILFFAIVVPIFFNLPEGLLIKDEDSLTGRFIAERAEKFLFDFDMIGEKVVGSYANENITVTLIKSEVEKIRDVMLHEYFELEMDVQQVSGAHAIGGIIRMYQGVQNIVIKLSSKDSDSESYLLMNSHFDSKPTSPGTGDDGAMVAVMLEMIRVFATTPKTFKHPIVFLFNGAEESGLQASHGLITQHKWAKNCKAVINLESAGSGHREILFQSGPNHPWLMKYYNDHVPRPYALTVGEEIFQSGLVPSDTDFRIFRDFGSIPGLDLAHTYNGYVYHTKFDKWNVIPRGTLQATGDNMLQLARALANAPELADTEKYSEGQVVFYDFLGLFLVLYTNNEAQIINTSVAVITIALVIISLWRIATNMSLPLSKVLIIFAIIFVLHLIGFILSFALPIAVAYIYDSADSTLTWFTNKWLIIGIYIVPSLVGLCLPTLLFLSWKRDDKLHGPFGIQMVFHAHSIIIGILCIIGTYSGIRSSYLLMISLLFYAISLLMNLITTLHSRRYYWIVLLTLCQILPFLYFTYISHGLLCTFIPMLGRLGTAINPDLIVSALCAICSVLAMGFLVHLLNAFRRPPLILLWLSLVFLVFVIISITPVGFPYRPATNVMRVSYLHVRRIFYEYDQSKSLDESGIYYDFLDRRKQHPFETKVNLVGVRSIKEDCDALMMCGLPLSGLSLAKVSSEGNWLSTSETVEVPFMPTLTLLQKVPDEYGTKMRYDFELKGPIRMSIFLRPLEGVRLHDWSFLRNGLEQPDMLQPTYQIYFNYGNDNSPLKFHFIFETTNCSLENPLFELGISGHYVTAEYGRSSSMKAFDNSFPEFVHVTAWPSIYQRYIF